MAKSTDNLELFVGDLSDNLTVIDIRSHKKIASNFKIARCCLVTYDNKFLITGQGGEYGKVLTKYDMNSRTQLIKWKSGVDECIHS